MVSILDIKKIVSWFQNENVGPFWTQNVVYCKKCYITGMRVYMYSYTNDVQYLSFEWLIYITGLSGGDFRYEKWKLCDMYW